MKIHPVKTITVPKPGDVLKECRTNCGLSVEELSDQSGIPKSSLWAYENGTRTPNRDVVEKIAPHLDLSGFDLYARMFFAQNHELHKAMGFPSASKEVLNKINKQYSNPDYMRAKRLADWVYTEASAEDRKLFVSLAKRMGFKG